MSAPDSITVRLAESATSGLASIVHQFLVQQLADSEKRRALAAKIHGRLALTATDYHTSVTVDFRGDEIAVTDGNQGRLDASIAGPYKSLTRLLLGETNPLVEHLRGRLRVRSRLRNPFLPLRVHRLIKLERAGK